MRLLHSLARTHASFDDPNLVSHAGLVPVMALAGRAGPGRPGRGACPAGWGVRGERAAEGAVPGRRDGRRARTASMTWTCCGTARCPRCSAGSGRRPRWARTCARFTWGNVSQLEKAGREFLGDLARRAPLLPGADTLAFIDIDSMQKRVYGHHKQGARFGHTKIQAAPRGALSYSRCSREKLGGRFLGLMAYLDPKGEGNNSMPEKQRSCSGMERCVAGPARYG